jgi:hypothetical protein
MTREKSEAQLDAEAEARDAGLRWYIVDLRRALAAETPARVHQQHTSKSVDDEVDERGWPKDADEGGLGLPFAAQMHRYLRTNAGRSDKHGWDLGPDPRVRPAMASIQETSEWCAPRHTSHLRPLQTRTLCGQLVFEVAYLGQEPSDVAWIHDLDLEDTEDMLLKALRHAYQWRIDAEQRFRPRDLGESDPLPERRPFRPAA